MYCFDRIEALLKARDEPCLASIEVLYSKSITGTLYQGSCSIFNKTLEGALSILPIYLPTAYQLPFG